MAKDTIAPRMIVPTTVPAVISVENMKAFGKSVRAHACLKPSRLNGAGRENALPSTAWDVVLKAMTTVTYRGTMTVTAARISTMVSDQLDFSPRTPRLRGALRVGDPVSATTPASTLSAVRAGCVVIRTRSFRG